MPRFSIPSRRRILGLDPALRTFGFAKLHQTESQLVPIELGLIVTSEVDDLSTSQSNFVSTQDLYAGVRDLMVDDHGNRLVDEIRAEAFSFPPNAMSAVMIGNCWGVISSLSRELGIPLKQASPQDIRRALHLPRRPAKEREDGKDDVLRAMQARFGEAEIETLLRNAGITRKADKRHPIDALAAAVAIR